MLNFYLYISAVFFLLHIIFETLASFIKYNFSSLGRHMTGISLSNIMAVLSRGCVAIFGIGIAFVIEKSLSNIETYSYLFSIILTAGAMFSCYLSKRKITEQNHEMIPKKSFFLKYKLTNNTSESSESSEISLSKFVAVLMGTQFIAVVVAYGLCFSLPDHRLIIISSVPLASMLGTMITIFYVEPVLARIIDKNNNMGYTASSTFLRARALSFTFSALIILIIPIGLSNLKA
jgi:hypothetical protein